MRDRDAQAGASNARRYVLELLPGLLGYLVLFLGLPALLGREEATWWSIPVALLPVVPLLWIVVAVIRHIRRIDDYQRRLVLIGMAFAFGAMMLTAVVIALLSTVDVVVGGTEWIVFGVGAAVWFGSSMWATTR
ncbi:hypothetical protein ACFJGV_10115 [Cnuibacter sp. UC19_7]|uniref:hypothetical protein n=1 Tax=Cnuibacter sp. UC19_7 TaxID=3350166 RepID=UPI00367339AA